MASGGSKRNQDGLTKLQELWVLHYTNADPEAGTFFNATQSARAAGYKADYRNFAACGASNLRNPKVMRAVDKLLSDQIDVAGITVDKVLIDLEITRRLAIQEKQYSVARRCTRDMGEFLKMFADRIEHVHTIEDADTNELAQLLRDVLTKIDDDNIAQIIAGAGGEIARAGSGVAAAGDTPAH